ncbi:MAG: hypothetical protein ACK5UY_07310 [Holosporales bacterium]
MRAELEKKGTPIGAMNFQIAATALLYTATLVTNNVREFSKVEGLVWEAVGGVGRKNTPQGGVKIYLRVILIFICILKIKFTQIIPNVVPIVINATQSRVTCMSMSRATNTTTIEYMHTARYRITPCSTAKSFLFIFFHFFVPASFSLPLHESFDFA